ncbi:MAG TPA: FAD/NAD(P)-binding protein, partial [Pseudonocardiaceae bacterium]|nr:FAD/NAD(P)-binding protein [Pseudonocardiaceae bacterium]
MRVAVIGLGSRGLGVLERIVTLAKLAGPAVGEVRVEIIDPICSGAGVHDTGQPDYLLLNTTAAAVSLFPDAHTVGTAVDTPGPSLYQWATERGLRIAEDGYTVGAEGRPVRPTDFLPRRLLGEYLSWFYGVVRDRAPSHVRLTEHHTEAVDL